MIILFVDNKEFSKFFQIIIILEIDLLIIEYKIYYWYNCYDIECNKRNFL